MYSNHFFWDEDLIQQSLDPNYWNVFDAAENNHTNMMDQNSSPFDQLIFGPPLDGEPEFHQTSEIFPEIPEWHPQEIPRYSSQQIQKYPRQEIPDHHLQDIQEYQPEPEPQAYQMYNWNPMQNIQDNSTPETTTWAPPIGNATIRKIHSSQQQLSEEETRRKLYAFVESMDIFVKSPPRDESAKLPRISGELKQYFMDHFVHEEDLKRQRRHGVQMVTRRIYERTGKTVEPRLMKAFIAKLRKEDRKSKKQLKK
uniref:Uncharacterized protein n=1 Tax=Caenorhabditis tropicalis TaxID=1561998 RepID=A0A1I7UVP6_9PELO